MLILLPSNRLRSLSSDDCDVGRSTTATTVSTSSRNCCEVANCSTKFCDRNSSQNERQVQSSKHSRRPCTICTRKGQVSSVLFKYIRIYYMLPLRHFDIIFGIYHSIRIFFDYLQERFTLPLPHCNLFASIGGPWTRYLGTAILD